MSDDNSIVVCGTDRLFFSVVVVVVFAKGLYHSQQQCGKIPFFDILILITILFDSSHPGGCEVLPTCGFDLHFLGG